ncbi:hypothetical protein BH11BAC3_BH11BAC3_37590 [soil metagenome]
MLVGLCTDVCVYPTTFCLLCSSCSSVYYFVVPLTSDLRPPGTPLRLIKYSEIFAAAKRISLAGFFNLKNYIYHSRQQKKSASMQCTETLPVSQSILFLRQQYTVYQMHNPIAAHDIYLSDIRCIASVSGTGNFSAAG